MVKTCFERVFEKDNPKTWPNDSRYLGKCFSCGSQYCGPKRSHYCWECSNKGIDTMETESGCNE